MKALGLVAVLSFRTYFSNSAGARGEHHRKGDGTFFWSPSPASVWLFRPEFDWKTTRVALEICRSRSYRRSRRVRHVGIAPGRYYVASGSLPPTVVPGTATTPRPQPVPPASRRYETAFDQEEWTQPGRSRWISNLERNGGSLIFLLKNCGRLRSAGAS